MKYCLAFLTLAFLTASTLSAQEIVAGLSSNSAAVGEPVQLVVTVRGARGADVPDNLSVNGLRINLAGRSTQFEMRNFKMSSTLTYTYIVVPQVEGDFTIPSFDVTIEGKTYRTQAMRLSVSGSARAPQMPSLPQYQVPSGPPGGSMPPPSSNDNARPYFAEMILSKKTAYVGEVVPVELRFYFHSRIGGQVGERPNFSGEGFTVQKFSNAVKREQVVDDTSYVVFTFQSAITAVKSGTLEIPAASLEARLNLPGNRPQGFDDFFSNLPIPQGMFNETQEVTIETKAQSLEVLPLPKEGRPDDFGGAVGKFTMDASVSPKKAEAGEPVTLTAKIAGRGNFDGMSAPTLTNDEGWRSYPPTDQFQANDAINFTGEKKFDFALVAREDQSATPGIRFSYFDPSSGKYETLVQAPLPVTAKAGSSAAGAPAPGPAPSQPQAGTTPPPVNPAATPDIAIMAGGSSSWQSLFFRKEFLIANACLALAWLALVIGFSLRNFSHSASGQRLARRRQARSALADLRSASPETFYAEVSRFLALRLNVPEDSVTEKITMSDLPDPVRAGVLALLEKHAEAKFAAGAAVPPSADERQEALAQLQQLDAACHEK